MFPRLPKPNEKKKKENPTRKAPTSPHLRGVTEKQAFPEKRGGNITGRGGVV